MKTIASLKIGQSKVVAGKQMLWIGLSSAFFQLLRTQGLTPQTMHKLDVAFTENRELALKRAQEIATKEGGTPLLLGLVDTPDNIERFDVRQKSVNEILPSLPIPLDHLKVSHMHA